MTADLAERIEAEIEKRGISSAELARRAHLSPKAISTFLLRAREKRAAPSSSRRRTDAPGLRSDTLRKIADALEMSVESLLGAQEASAEIPFAEFVRWAHQNKAIATVLTLHGDNVTVGDLLRYKAGPANSGEFNADEVWEQIKQLRRGINANEATPLSEAQEGRVGPPKRRPMTR